MSGGEAGAPEERPALRVVRGDPSAEELAALTVVLHAVSAASASAAASQTDRPRSQWSAPRRRLRTTFPHGPGAWRASGLPR
ncbi:MAG TPA: acyl-CoA carboxylase subunit epsilon [Nocardioidaceae bacterium]|nr:acyl-CoA carboxylase subunit epsilon [Nocardioidaceae bacterium]